MPNVKKLTLNEEYLSDATGLYTSVGAERAAGESLAAKDAAYILGLAARIRQTRTARSWTQADLAHAAGKQQEQISRIENPRSNRFPNLQTLMDVSRAFDMPLADLLTPQAMETNESESTSDAKETRKKPRLPRFRYKSVTSNTKVKRRPKKQSTAA